MCPNGPSGRLRLQKYIGKRCRTLVYETKSYGTGSRGSSQMVICVLCVVRLLYGYLCLFWSRVLPSLAWVFWSRAFPSLRGEDLGIFPRALPSLWGQNLWIAFFHVVFCDPLFLSFPLIFQFFPVLALIKGPKPWNYLDMVFFFLFFFSFLQLYWSYLSLCSHYNAKT